MSGIPPRMLWLLGVLLAFLLVAPALLGKYGLSVLILVLYFAYVGQAWNIMMGFAGQLSLGHALYAGLGGYIAAGLFLHYGLGPWAGVFVAVAAASLAGTSVNKFRPGGLLLVRAGGDAGMFSGIIGGWSAGGARGSLPVTKEVRP